MPAGNVFFDEGAVMVVLFELVAIVSLVGFFERRGSHRGAILSLTKLCRSVAGSA
jgi:hypothetical protein